MKRREFIKNSIIITSTIGALSSCSNEPDLPPNQLKDYISGFIFSDAHIGWKGADQPTLEHQSKAIQNIQRFFPDLDLVFDTGDLHHGYLDEDERNNARNFWLTKMVNPFSRSFFHYVPGNHELGKGPFDEEITANSLGSNAMRPYYSFDYKGIHFVSLPQLSDTILINKESLSWLEHDLLVNKNKTTLIFSHNSISNTTYDNGEDGYRTIVNSEQLLDVIDSHGNVIAWFHGHNHQFELVYKHKRLYVSNGRIGGFDPPKNWGNFGQGHIGGIYFSINHEKLIVKCFSADKEDYFENFGFTNLSFDLQRKTTFNQEGEFNYYTGHGMMTNNVPSEIFNHYLSHNKIKISQKILGDKALNDNANFELDTELFFIGKRIKRLIGYQLIADKSLERKTVDNGLLVKSKRADSLVINVPSIKKTKLGYMQRPSYIRCESGDKYSLQIEYLSNSKIQKVLCIFRVYDANQRILHESDSLPMSNTNNIFKYTDFEIPQFDNEIINKYLRISFKFIGIPEEFILNKLSILKTIESNENAMKIGDDKYKFNTKNQLNINESPIQQGGKTFLKYLGKDMISCHIQIKNVDWQVRNAFCGYDKNEINLINYRQTFQRNKEVVLTPTNKRLFYVNKVIDIMPLTISYSKNMIVIKMINILPEAGVVVFSKIKIKKLIGGKLIRLAQDEYIIKPKSKVIEITF